MRISQFWMDEINYAATARRDSAMRPHKISLRLIGPTGLLLILVSVNVAFGQTSGFTYQGRLQDSGTNANGSYDFQFTLWDALSGGTQQPQPTPITITKSGVAVNNGAFIVQLDFGPNAFPGAGRFLEISVRPANSGTFTVLSPRQPITATPYAVRSLNAASADSVPVSGVPAGSGNYIQNTTAQQASSNFNISGGGVIAGNLAVGTSNANARFHVVDTTNVAAGYFQNLGSGDAVRGEGSTNGITGGVGVRGIGLLGIFGSTPNDGTGVRGTSSSGIGVLGTSTTGVGVHGQSNGLAGRFDGRVWVQGVAGSVVDVLPTGGQNLFLGGGNFTGSELKLSNSGTAHFSIYNSGNSSLTFANTSANLSANTPGSPLMSITSGGNVGIGTTSPNVKLEVNGRALFNTTGNNGFRITPGTDADIGVLNVTNAANTVNWLTVGNNGQVIMNGAGNVGIGTLNPQAKLEINALMPNGFAGAVRLTSAFLEFNALSGGGTTACLSSRGNGYFGLSNCSSSLRYKNNISNFTDGLNLLLLLQPIAFDWKQDGSRDLGLAAEAVEKIEPLLVTYKDHRVEGVKYDRISVVLINAVKEQQAQIQLQQDQLKRQDTQIKKQEAQARQQQAAFVSQQQQLDALKLLVCGRHRRAAVCK